VITNNHNLNNRKGRNYQNNLTLIYWVWKWSDNNSSFRFCSLK